MTTPLGRLVAVNPGVPEFLDDLNALVTFMPLECVWPDGHADISRRAKASAVSSGYTVFRRGDILLPKITPTFEAGRVAIAGIETPVGAGTTEIHVLRVKPSVDPRFVTYVCRSQPFLQEGHARIQGVGNLRRVPREFIAKFSVKRFDQAEQRAIADHLDLETAKIDTLIAKQELLVVTLRERRRAVLDTAFLAGDHTVTRRVQHLAAARPTYGVLVPRYVDEGDTVPFVRVGDLARLEPGIDLPHITKAQSREYSRTSLRGGEILLGVVGKMGQTAIAPAWLAGANVARAVAVLRCRDVDSTRLLHLWLATTHFLDQALLATSGDSVQPTLGMGDLSSFVLHWPTDNASVARQVAHLDDQTAKIDALIAKTEQFIKLSKERRTALITAAVTGQVDVWKSVCRSNVNPT